MANFDVPFARPSLLPASSGRGEQHWLVKKAAPFWCKIGRFSPARMPKDWRILPSGPELGAKQQFLPTLFTSMSSSAWARGAATEMPLHCGLHVSTWLPSAAWASRASETGHEVAGEQVHLSRDLHLVAQRSWLGRARLTAVQTPPSSSQRVLVRADQKNQGIVWVGRDL